jgi:hypothetical protein
MSASAPRDERDKREERCEHRSELHLGLTKLSLRPVGRGRWIIG